MRRSVLFSLLVLPLVPACATTGSKNGPSALGGSVADFDRGASSFSPDTGSPAGASDTIGIASTNGRTSTDWDELVEPSPAASALVAGPIQARSRTPETIRATQRALIERGYFHGAVNGNADPALTEALSRFQADHGFAITGRLDGDTAGALSVPLPKSAPPPGAM